MDTQLNCWTLSAVRQALHYYSHIDPLGEGESGQNKCLETRLRGGNLATSVERGYCVQAALQWGLASLQKSHSAYDRQSAETLTLRYVERRTVAATAAHLKRSHDTIKHRQRKGIERLAHLLQSAHADPLIQTTWQTASTALHYAALTPDEQRTLRFWSHFNSPISWRVTTIVTLPFLTTEQLVAHHWLIPNETGQLSIHDDVQQWVQQQATRAEKLHDHQIAARYYEQAQHFSEAIAHWQQTADQEKAAQLLLAQFDTMAIADKRACLMQFERSALSDDKWKKVCLLRGRVAHTLTQLDAALEQYELALASPSYLIRAEAYYRIARVYEMRDIDAALTHYTNCLALLADKKDEASGRLRVEALISEAWIFIDARLDLVRALLQLEHATESSLQGRDRAWLQLRSDLETAWSEYFVRKQEMTLCVSHRWKAWSYAREADDVNRTIQTSYNLGLVYLQTGRGEDAYHLFQECYELTAQINDHKVAAMAHKGLGMYAVLVSADYPTAIAHYLQTYSYMNQANNHYLLATLCYDLAEAYLLNQQPVEAFPYYQQAQALAVTLENDRLGAALEGLAGVYGELSAELAPPQRQIIAFVRVNGRITKQQCITLTGLSSRQALRELNGLVACEKLRRTGNNRSTAYILVLSGANDS